MNIDADAVAGRPMRCLQMRICWDAENANPDVLECSLSQSVVKCCEKKPELRSHPI